jgi:Xaa-Pro dipeptidase
VLGAGLRESYDNFTGYTLGYCGATHPLRTSDFTRAFGPEPGTVFHVYTGARGMAFSETVLVPDSGAERLTRLERRLLRPLRAPDGHAASRRSSQSRRR